MSAIVYSSLVFFLRKVPDALNAVAFLAFVYFFIEHSKSYSSIEKYRYPVIYAVVVIPITVNRYLATNAPRSFYFFSAYTFAFAGFFNAILYLTTRKDVFRVPGHMAAPATELGHLPNAGTSNDRVGQAAGNVEEDWPELPA